MAKSLRFIMTKLIVPDIAAAERFYCDVLGFRLERRHVADDHEYPQEEAILAFGEAGGHVLILARYLDRPCPPAGAAWTALVVEDAAASAAAVIAAGGKIEVPLHRSDAHGLDVVVVSDPIGHLIEMVQVLPPA